MRDTIYSSFSNFYIRYLSRVVAVELIIRPSLNKTRIEKEEKKEQKFTAHRVKEKKREGEVKRQRKMTFIFPVLGDLRLLAGGWTSWRDWR